MDRTLVLLIIGGFILSSDFHSIMRTSPVRSNGYASYASDSNNERTRHPARVYQYPEFYRGMYLTVASANNFQKLRYFVEKAISSNINTLVLDVQSARNAACMVPESHVRYCIDHRSDTLFPQDILRTSFRSRRMHAVTASGKYSSITYAFTTPAVPGV